MLICFSAVNFGMTVKLTAVPFRLRDGQPFMWRLQA